MVSSTGEEQDMPDHRTRQHDPESDENEERREIGGGMLREVAIKSGYLLKKGERRKVSIARRDRQSPPYKAWRRSLTAPPFAPSELEEAILCAPSRQALLLQGRQGEPCCETETARIACSHADHSNVRTHRNTKFCDTLAWPMCTRAPKSK